MTHRDLLPESNFTVIKSYLATYFCSWLMGIQNQKRPLAMQYLSHAISKSSHLYESTSHTLLFSPNSILCEERQNKSSSRKQEVVQRPRKSTIQVKHTAASSPRASTCHHGQCFPRREGQFNYENTSKCACCCHVQWRLDILKSLLSSWWRLADRLQRNE
jgi:hypothetical protein